MHGPSDPRLPQAQSFHLRTNHGSWSTQTTCKGEATCAGPGIPLSPQPRCFRPTERKLRQSGTPSLVLPPPLTKAAVLHERSCQRSIGRIHQPVLAGERHAVQPFTVPGPDRRAVHAQGEGDRQQQQESLRRRVPAAMQNNTTVSSHPPLLWRIFSTRKDPVSIGMLLLPFHSR